MVYKSNYQNFLTNINKNSKIFSKAERKLAVFFRNNNESLININVSDIAKQANVSKSTVSRFIRKLGYTDFTEFRYLLQEKTQKSPVNIENNNDDIQHVDYICRIKREYNFLIDRTINQLEEPDLAYFVHQLTSAHNIYIAGLGSSGFSAKEMSRKFIQLGFSLKVLDEMSLILKYTHIMKQPDLFLVFSTHGESKYLLQAIKLARANHVQVILITNFAESILIKYAHRVFLTTREPHVPNNIVVFPRLSQMFLIDVLFNAVIISDIEKYNMILKTMSESQKQYREHYLATSD